MNKICLVIALVFVVGLGIGFSVNVSGEEALIPSWIKNTAGFWADNKISDNEFIQALQYLVKEGILVIPSSNDSQTSSQKDSSPDAWNQDKQQSEVGFSKTNCVSDGIGGVKMTGKYTNGDIPYESIFFKLAVIGDDDSVVATGPGLINNVGAHETRIFDAHATYSGPFKSCEIEVSDTFEN